MHRFFVLSKDISKGRARIADKAAVHHIKDVLRLREKENTFLIDELGNKYSVEIEKITPVAAEFTIKNKHLAACSKKIRLTIACAIPKKARMDEIIDKLTQLGTDEIIPLITTRTIVRFDRRKQEDRLRRWKKIALSASLQSQRREVPKIEGVKEFSAVLPESRRFDLKIIPALSGKNRPLKEVLAKYKPKSVLVLIGPEGDFTEAEIRAAEESGFIPASLGKLVLRVDTAAVCVASFIHLFYS